MVKILLIIGIIYMAVRLISLKRQVKIIEAGLRNKERINITLNSKDMESLAESANNLLQEEKQNSIALENRENLLKQSISDISHDLRTPLAAIRGYLTLLEECSEEEKLKYTNILKKKSLELNKLINNYYELSIWDNPNYKIETKAIDIVEVATEAVISNYALIMEKEIDFNNRFPEKKIEVQGEEIACGRIVQNLISNAIKYTTGYVAIEIDEADDNVIFAIRNSVSKDLKESDLENLFNRFYMVDKSRQSGTGLGLFIVKILLEKLGGEIKEVSLKEEILSILILFKKV